MRPKREYRTASKESYNNFCELHPNVIKDYKAFKAIIYKWNEMYGKHLIETGDKLKMPYGLGPIVITKYKPKGGFITAKNGISYPNRAINWAATQKEGKVIYHLNNNTDGWKYYFLWQASESYIRQNTIWKCEMARIHSRLLSKYLQNPEDEHKDIYRQWNLKS